MRILQFILTTTLIVFADYLFAQQTFEKIIAVPEDQVINSVIEDNDGNYFLAGRIKNSEGTRNSGYIIKLDSSGNLMQEKIISPNDTLSSLFLNIHFFNDYCYVIGTEIVNYPDTSKLWYLKFNSNLEIEDEKTLAIPYGRWFSYMNSIIDSDTNLVITGYTTRVDETNNYNNDAFFYKLNINGDSLNSKFYTSYIPLHFSFDIIESQDSSLYYAFVSHFENTSGGQKLILNKNPAI